MADLRGQTTLPRGLRDNNPGDLEAPPGTSWAGTVGMDAPFVIFSDTTWGLRALAKDLINNIAGEGYDTITSLIGKFAPPSENNTDAYIAAVSADTGIDADVQLGTDQDTITSLMRAIVNHELGDSYSLQYVPDADIATGYSMATSGLSAVQGTVVTAVAAAADNPATTAAVVIGLILVGWMLLKSKRKN
jgi:hypothetical protein